MRLATNAESLAHEQAGVSGWVPFANVRETHSAVVFLFGDRAYKVKKDVDLGFLDFRDRDHRRAVCRRELTLNRRLADDVYLGVTELEDPVTGEAEPVLVMRRMPDTRRLARLVREHADLHDGLRELAHRIAGFHGRSPQSRAISEAATRDALAARWEASFAQLRPFHDTVLSAEVVTEIEALARSYLAGRKPLFDSRIAQGSIVDGHGDLMAEDIFLLDDGPRVLDCIEFDDTLRHVDRVDDVAFLAMDLERLGDRDAGRRFLDLYCELSGDHPPGSLLHHYVAYRAFVRAKVSCLQHAQGVREADRAARLLSELALDHLRQGQVRLVLVGGAPGTGKSTLAQGVADRMGMVCVGTDRVRKELLGAPGEASLAAPYGSGAYSPEWTGRTYAEVLRRAEALLVNGESVVLDATWADESYRSQAARLARRTHSALAAFLCQLPEEIVETRIEGREGVSDADAAIARAVRGSFARWPEAVVVDTTETPARAVDTVVGALAPRAPRPGPRSHLAPG